MTDILAHIEQKLKKTRQVTTILFIIPWLCLLLTPFNFIFWPLFCLTLFPFSVIILATHFFLGKKRRKYQLKINELDNVKIFIAVGGTVIGTILLALFYLVTH